MLEWVIRAMPAIIILENVCGAPWGVMEKELQQVGYTTASSGSYHDPSKPAGKRGTTHFFDTKFFYIPHTRTRGYLIAIRSDIAELPKDLPRVSTTNFVFTSRGTITQPPLCLGLANLPATPTPCQPAN
jgi:site-specific DNA-cytosine methylase